MPSPSDRAPSPPGGEPAVHRLKPVADLNLCCGYGLCEEVCPQVFKLGDEGHVTLVVEVVPEGLEKQAREAAASCPQNALAVEEI